MADKLEYRVATRGARGAALLHDANVEDFKAVAARILERIISLCATNADRSDFLKGCKSE
jgi:hypothetical protein